MHVSSGAWGRCSAVIPAVRTQKLPKAPDHVGEANAADSVAVASEHVTDRPDVVHLLYQEYSSAAPNACGSGTQ